MPLCDVHTQMVCQYHAVLNADVHEQGDAIQRLIDEEDTVTLRCLCKWAYEDNTLCRMLSILMCYAIDANRFNSFRCLMLHLPNYPWFHEFGSNSVGVYTLMHSAALFRPRYMHLLLKKFVYNSFELATANHVAEHHKQGWVSDILEPFSSQCPTPMHAHKDKMVRPYRSTPFAFKNLNQE